MRNAVQAGTWKRLTCVLILTVAISTGLIAPIPNGEAIPQQQNCAASGRNTIIAYYQTSNHSDFGCWDVLYPCPGEYATEDCYHTPYTATFCGQICSLS